MTYFTQVDTRLKGLRYLKLKRTYLFDLTLTVKHFNLGKISLSFFFVLSNSKEHDLNLKFCREILWQYNANILQSLSANER